MNKPLFLGNNFSCIVKFICLVDRPFLVVSCLKKNKRWDFTEQLWLKIAVRAQGAFFKLWPKSHQFLPNKSDSHCPRGGFRFKPIWNLTFLLLFDAFPHYTFSTHFSSFTPFRRISPRLHFKRISLTFTLFRRISHSIPLFRRISLCFSDIKLCRSISPGNIGRIMNLEVSIYN